MSTLGDSFQRHARVRQLAALIVFAFGAIACAQVWSADPNAYGRSVVPQPQVAVPEKAILGVPAWRSILDFPTDHSYRLLSRSVGRLDFRARRRDGSLGFFTCTATLIARDLILTNHHCVPTDEAVVLEASLLLGYTVGAEGEGERFPVRIDPLDADSNLDFSVLFVEGAPGDRYGYVALDVRAPEPDDRLFIIHHPRGKPQMVSYDCVLYSQQVTGLLRHRCDTEGGSSGSLVFTERDGRIVGLHYATSFTDATPVELRFNVAKDILEVVRRSDVLSGLQSPSESQANLRVQSVPSRATVTIDGRDYGMTPTTIRFAAPGVWTVTLSLEGYVDYVETISIDAGDSELTALLREAIGPTPVPPSVAALQPEQVEEFMNRARAGGTIHLAAGTFYLPHSLHLENDVQIIGAGRAATTIQTSDSPWIRRPNGHPLGRAVLLFSGSGASTLHGLTVRFAGADASTDVIHVRSGELALRDVLIAGGSMDRSQDYGGVGVRFSGSASGAIEQSAVMNNASAGILLFDQARTVITETTISANLVGVSLNDYSRGTLTGNTIDGNQRHGVFCGNDSVGVLDRNALTNNGWYGIGSHTTASCSDAMSRFGGNVRGDREEPF